MGYQANNAERSSFFEQLFGRAARSSRTQGHGKHFSDAMQGNDHHARSRCTSQETALGHLISIEDLGITASLVPSRAKREARSAWPHA